MKKIMCYIIGIITLFLIIIIIKRFMFQEEIESISYEIKSYNKIEYPYFNNKVINKEIKNFLNNFKGEYSIQYSVYQVNDLINVFICLKKNKNYYYKSINYNNFILSYFISIILGIILYLLIYLPINSLFGYNTIFAISLLFVIYIFIEYVSYYIMNMNVNKYNKILGMVGIICIYFIFYALVSHYCCTIPTSRIRFFLYQ